MRTVSTSSIYQVASAQWGAEDEKVGPAILSRLGQRAEARGDALAGFGRAPSGVTVDGRVGVVGSGQAMTSYKAQKTKYSEAFKNMEAGASETTKRPRMQ